MFDLLPRSTFRWLLAMAATMAVVPAQAQHHHNKVILVSIDGLRGTELASLPKSDLPNLSDIVAKGAVADGLVGVFPTVTIPNHVSMVTGVFPAVHGVFANALFEAGEFPGTEGDNDYAGLIRVPTLWQIAHRAGLRTASVLWPATIGADIDFDFPEYRSSAGVGNLRDHLLYGAISTPGLVADYEKRRGPLPIADHADDAVIARLAVFLMQTRRPDLLLVHFEELDDAEHDAGPDSSAAIAKLQHIDGYIGELRHAATRAGSAPHTYFVVVSDHGFAAVDRALHPNAVLSSFGLLGTRDPGGVARGCVWHRRLVRPRASRSEGSGSRGPRDAHLPTTAA